MHPQEAGLHLGIVDHDDTLAVVAIRDWRDHEEVSLLKVLKMPYKRPAHRTSARRRRLERALHVGGRNGDDRWVIRKKIRQRHTLGS